MHARLLLFVLFFVPATAEGQGPILYLDPVAGVDTPGGGGTANPLRSLTFAVTQVGAGPATFRLRAGVYTTPAESFPINLPATCVVESDPNTVRSGQNVVINGQPAAQIAALQAIGGNGPLDITLRNLTVQGGNYQCVVISALTGTNTLLFLAEGCTFNQYFDLDFVIGGNTVAVLQTSRCTFRGLDVQIRLNCRGTSQTFLTIDRGVIGGGWIGVDLAANASSTVSANLRGVRIDDAGLHGIRMASQSTGTVNVRTEHCLFRVCGTRFIGGPSADLGAITDNTAARAGVHNVTVENTIFSGNENDCAHYNPATYTFGRNLVQQQSLFGVGGNMSVAPLFVEPRRNDYHLLPGSPAIDAGSPLATTLLTDFEGDPRPAGAAPDIGPDESYDRYFYSHGAAHVGGPSPQSVTMRALAAPGTAFVGFAATAVQPGLPWAPGVVHLLPPVFGPLVSGVTGTNGLGEVVLLLPVDQSLIDVAIWWQGVFSSAPYIGINPHRMFLRY